MSDYPKEYTHGIPMPYMAPTGYTWPLKVSGEFAKALKTDPMIWATQYQQTPTAEKGEIFDSDWWRHYEYYDPINSAIIFEDDTAVQIMFKAIYADTAQKTAERNDFSVFQLWAMLIDGRGALLEQERGKYEAPDLQDNFLAFCERHEFQVGVNNMGVRVRKVEDKSSGTGLIQAINRLKGFDYIEGIPRDKDKVSRAKSGAPEIKKGKVLLPRAEWVPEYIEEFHKFNSMMTHKHDDQIDPTLDMIHDNLIDSQVIGYANVVGGK